jgi:hypothetical protein
VWPDGVVLRSPLFCQYLDLLQRVKDLAVQQLVPYLPVEALVMAVLPGIPWLDEQGREFDSHPGHQT